MESLSDAFRALGDSTRLRIVRLLGEAPLNVSELVSLVGIGQSSVSHHLARLKSLELIGEARQAGFTYYSLKVSRGDPRWPLIDLARSAEDPHGDRARLSDLLRRREDRATLNERLLEPGQSWQLWSEALASLLPPLEVADFGCGTGVLTVELARWARQVTAVDHSPEALQQASARAAREGRANVRFLEADLAQLPLEAACMDLVVASQCLHHVQSPALVLGEAARLLRPGGRLAVLELMPHQEQWVRERLGHLHLGFEPEALAALAGQAGFTALTLSPTGRDGASAFRVFLLNGAKP
jgi:SAM-dependent methyltransferase